jgi:hypothetical protein
MKLSNRVKTLIFSLIAVTALGLIFLPGQQTQKAAQNTNQNTGQSSSRAEYINRVSQGLAEAQLTSVGITPTVAVNSMANTMELRSGVNFSPVVRQQLTTMETAAINGKQELVSFDRFVDILTDSVLEQASRLTDQEINQLITTARGFNASGVPEKLQAKNVTTIGIFPGYYVQVSDKEAFTQIKAARDANAQLFIKPLIHSKIKEQVTTRLSNFAKASPTVFGQTWDSTNNLPAKGLTPTQAMLLTYSIVSGDSFADSTTTLTTAMQNKQYAVTKAYGAYPSANGHSAYGANGYLFSSAFALFFNEENQLNLLNKLS